MVLTGCFSDSGSSQPPSVEPPSSNHPPSVESVPELTALVDHKVTYQLVASDRDGDSLSYQLNDAPDFVSVDKLGLVTIAPKEPDQDQYQFSISVSDGKAKVTTQIRLNVFAQPTASCPEDTTDPECNNDSGFQPNFAPELNVDAQIDVKADIASNYQVSAKDYNGDQLSFSLNQAPSWASIDSQGLMSLVPTAADVGTYELAVIVSDGTFDVTADTQVTVHLGMTPVDPDLINHAPVVDPIPALTAKVQRPLIYQVLATDKDGDALTYSLNNAPDFITIDSTGELNIFANSNENAGKYFFSVIVSDSNFTVSQKVELDVGIPMTPVDPDLVNHAPVVVPIPELTAQILQQSTYQVFATDKDNDVLTYFLKDAPDFVSISENGLLYIEPLNNSNAGSHHSQVLVSDGSLTTSRNLTIHVSEQDEPGNDNNAPIVQSIAPITAFTDQTLEYQVIASDRDGDRLSFSLNNSPEFVSVTQSGVLTFAPTPVHEGNHQFDVTVSDGKLSTKTTVIAQVHLPTASCDEDSTAPECVNPDEGMEVTFYKASLTASNKPLKGDVSCNGQSLLEGHFNTTEGDSFTCYLESLDSSSIELGSFIAPDHKSQSLNSDALVPIAFELTNVIGKGDNAAKVLESISSCPESQQVCLNKMDSIDIAGIYNSAALDSDETVGAFLAAKSEESTDDVGKAPSSHRDPNLVPAVSGGDNDLNSDFVSSNAEASLTYQPSVEAQVLTRSTLTDAHGLPIVGISYFSAHSTGVTDANGEFEYLWGDSLTFGIDTFEFGSVIGNKVSYQLADVTENPVVKANIQALLQRYGEASGEQITIDAQVRDVFSQYPNVINELIKLTLPNGGKLEGTSFNLPNEFEKQFEQGLTALIDQSLKKTSVVANRSPVVFSLNDDKYVTNSLKAIFDGVTTFHVFNDNSSFYGATGYTRGMRMLNMSNRAFPIVMPRTDINRQIAFDEAQAWTREGKPYIANWPDIEMPAIPKVSKDNATFGFPFVTAGEIGLGKVVFMGNSLYPSILSCPNNYWANDALRIDSTAYSCTTTVDLSDDPRNDHGSMKRFFSNLFQWLAPELNNGGIRVATNIDLAAAARSNVSHGTQYDFFISPEYGFYAVDKISKGGFEALSITETPLLILQGYQPKVLGDGMTHRYIADLDQANLTQEDITALIHFINDGGSVIFMDAIDEKLNPEPLGRLADAAGMSIGGSNVTPTNQAFCGSSYYCQSMYPNLHVRSRYDMVVLERFPDVNGKRPYQVNDDGSITWAPPIDMPSLEIPQYQVEKLDSNGKPMLDESGQPIMETKHARIFVQNEQETAAAIAELQNAFPGTSICSHDYEYEIDCIEIRKGDGVVVRGNYWRKDFDRYQINPDVVDSMVKAANLGTNIQALMDHELYYRTKGNKGIRLSTTELNQTYDNLSVWLWNNNDYAYDQDVQDELGFETLVNYLNCYTNNKHGNGGTCPDSLKAQLIEHKMIHGEGELLGQMNPSYPLNYTEKPLTRIMLGRSFWDYDIKVDTSAYPGQSTGEASSVSIDIKTAGSPVTFSAGNNQSTGLWAPQLQEVTVTGGVEANITVMMADDLTGKPQHETRLNRPPRMQMNFAHDGGLTKFTVPYGGLITVKPISSASADNARATFTFDGVQKAAWWKEGKWVHSIEESTAPIAEVDTGSFIYTTAVKNLTNADLVKFSEEMNQFAEAASDFYGRDEVTTEGKHRRFTYEDLAEFRHRFVNDVQISIGAAHSGYPVMNSGFNAQNENIPLQPLASWLLWHEVGHNLASAPFTAAGSTEVTNNLLALYMQEQVNGKMVRIEADIQKAPYWLEQNSGHAWSHGDAGLRLVMFGQLKIWAQDNFIIDNWYSSGTEKPSIYNHDQGWNMFKFMHRKSRGDSQGDESMNYCSAQATGLSGGDLMMLCSSYVANHDLSDFFTLWNVGETSSTSPEGIKTYSGGISSKALTMLAGLKLPKPETPPQAISHLPDAVVH